ncbi:TraH family protein [Neoaquamicrobium sediminum]|uniref:TraH family protein n=1 Tax=Neoaquamicrobium sediminum TaxID=1849104 RepID=UPI001567BF66|nr:TraH family protein [Mesorhizobium sediminum]NRC57279.1 conjugal transfer protein TraH [Mesorhizobium sediminum]
MFDAALIQQCADPSLPPAIVERFITEVGVPDPLAVDVRVGNRVVLIPPVRTRDEAMAVVRQYVGRAIVRVGVTQYPAGVGIADASELFDDLVDACANISMGTALFGKVYRIVTRWYGAEPDEAFEDAVLAWRSGFFEGRAVFHESDPGASRSRPMQPPGYVDQDDATLGTHGDIARRQPMAHHDDEDPDKAGIRIDLSRIGSGELE